MVAGLFVYGDTSCYFKTAFADGGTVVWEES